MNILTFINTKKTVFFLLTLLIIIPNLVFAQDSLFSKEKTDLSQNNEPGEVLKDSQNIVGVPEGAGMILGVEDINLKPPRYLPKTTAYAYMQVIEKIRCLFVSGKEDKISYYLELAEKRLSEINQATKIKKRDKIKISLKKAASHYEAIYEILKKHKGSKLLTESDIKTLSNHMTILTILEQESSNSILRSEFDEPLKFTMLIQLENDKL